MLFRTITILLIVFLSTFSVFAESTAKNMNTGSVDYSLYDRVLKAHVNSRGEVDYAALKGNSKQLRQFIRQLADFSPESFKSFGFPEQIAFYINAYNAITLEVIIDNYPIKAGFLDSLKYPSNSIRQIKDAWTSNKHRVMGRPISLDQLEHQILRKNYHEPRIHFALVCAAKSCPFLRNEAYRGEQLDEQLDDQTRRFLAEESNYRYVRGKLQLSAILDWFAADFEYFKKNLKNKQYFPEKYHGVVGFLQGYQRAKGLANVGSSVEVEIAGYDWTLNDVR